MSDEEFDDRFEVVGFYRETLDDERVSRLRLTVPPDGTCAGKATLVDVSGDPIGYHLREALRLLEERGAGDDESETLVNVKLALEAWQGEA